MKYAKAYPVLKVIADCVKNSSIERTVIVKVGTVLLPIFSSL